MKVLIEYGSQTCTVNLCLVSIKYRNPYWTMDITVPGYFLFYFKEKMFPKKILSLGTLNVSLKNEGSKE